MNLKNAILVIFLCDMSAVYACDSQNYIERVPTELLKYIAVQLIATSSSETLLSNCRNFLQVSKRFADAGKDTFINDDKVLNKVVQANGINAHKIHAAAQFNASKWLKTALVSSAWLAHKLDSDTKNTPLHIAVRHSASEAAELLVQYGADVHAQNISQETALHSAAEHNNVAAVMLLLKKGASAKVQNSRGEIPLHVAIDHWATEAAIALLTADSPSWYRDNAGNTAIHKAALLNNTAVLQAMFERGAHNFHPNFMNNRGETPLHRAVVHAAREAVEFLVTHGARSDLPNDNNKTPIVIARERAWSPYLSSKEKEIAEKIYKLVQNNL